MRRYLCGDAFDAHDHNHFISSTSLLFTEVLFPFLFITDWRLRSIPGFAKLSHMAKQNPFTPRSARPSNLHEVVKELRKKQRKTTAALAAEADVSVRTIQRMEAGEPTSADTILRVEKALLLAPGTLVERWETGETILSAGIGPRMRELRRKRRVTITQAAGYSRLSVAMLSRLERGLLGDLHWEELPINFNLIRLLGFSSRDQFEEWVEGKMRAPVPAIITRGWPSLARTTSA